MMASQFEDAIAACNLLPGPASTQLSIFCAWTVAGIPGAIVGGLAFIVPGLVVILALAALFLAAAPPEWILAAGAGAGAAVVAVAVHAGVSLVPSSWSRASHHRSWVLYAVLGGAAGAAAGPWLVLVVLSCGAVEYGVDRFRRGVHLGVVGVPLASAVGVATGGLAALAWVAVKVGALAYGGGFVIVPMMQHDAVHQYHWMTDGQFLNAVALGQITPGPVVLTVAVVGFAAAGVWGGLVAAAIAFAPSFAFILLGASHFEELRRSRGARAFLNGSGPAAIGAILGSAVPLAAALGVSWQYPVMAGAALVLFVARRSVVLSLVLAAAAGVIAVALGAPLPQ
jgi:chromate transporter